MRHAQALAACRKRLVLAPHDQRRHPHERLAATRARGRILAMARAAKTLSFSHITKTPEVCGGQPVIDDTRVRVMNIAALHKEGKTPEQMLVEYPSLNLAQGHAALSYYYDHTEEIDAALQ